MYFTLIVSLQFRIKYYTNTAKQAYINIYCCCFCCYFYCVWKWLYFSTLFFPLFNFVFRWPLLSLSVMYPSRLIMWVTILCCMLLVGVCYLSQQVLIDTWAVDSYTLLCLHYNTVDHCIITPHPASICCTFYLVIEDCACSSLGKP